MCRVYRIDQNTIENQDDKNRYTYMEKVNTTGIKSPVQLIPLKNVLRPRLK